MSAFSLLAFVLIAVSCQGLSSAKAVSDQQQADLANHITAALSEAKVYSSAAQQIPQNQFRNEARPKRSQHFFGNNKDISNNLELDEVENTSQQSVDDVFEMYYYNALTQAMKALIASLETANSKAIDPTHYPRRGRSIDVQRLFGPARDKKSDSNWYSPRLGKRANLQCD